MKKSALILITVLILLSSASCADKQGQTSTQPDTATAPLSQSETVTQDHSPDPEYVKAVKNLYEKYKALQEEDGFAETPVTAYLTDINGDGYKDIICCYSPIGLPVLDIYKNGEFVNCPIETEVMAGSMSPSGKESGYFIDAEKGIIVVRYDSHTTGTVLYRGAEAFQIEGTQAKSLWVEYYDEEAHNGVEDYMLESEEYYEQVNSLVNKEFDEKQYLPRIRDYNLVNFFDVYAPWDGSVM